MKTCTKCGLDKSLSEFAKDKYNPDGLTYSCKQCRNTHYNNYYEKNPDKQQIKNNNQKNNRKAFYNSEKGVISSRRSHLKRIFNITLEEYNALSIKQNHKCAICKEEEIYYRNKVLCVDHDHTTGKIRGLLCNRCNRSIGLLKDSIEILENAIKYLKNVQT
jgi:hypothetical protein